ncbi:MAG TPA: hypothetical protein VGB54_09255 [Allosphingosinicella sp.]|jgi:hypothetical protein
MAETEQTKNRRRHGIGTPAVMIAVAAVTAANAAAWFYFRKRQPATDEQTRDRLQPRKGGRP